MDYRGGTKGNLFLKKNGKRKLESEKTPQAQSGDPVIRTAAISFRQVSGCFYSLDQGLISQKRGVSWAEVTESGGGSDKHDGERFVPAGGAESH